MRRLIVLAIMLLAAVSPANAVSRKALVGSWVYPEEQCQGDAGLIFRSNVIGLHMTSAAPGH
jgi:hypothetical protein